MDEAAVMWKKTGYYILVAYALLVMMVPTGCGVKGPPIPPDRTQPPGVTDLDVGIENNMLTLSWSIPLNVGRETAIKSEFVVFRSKKMTYQACLDCPDVFTKVTQIPFYGDKWSKIENGRMAYREILEPGFAYAYKIIIYVKGAASGSYSNVVRFAH